jgi:hypothetical protein
MTMADKAFGHIEGNLHGKTLAVEIQDKIEDVLRSSLEQELAKDRPTVGAAAALRRPSHGSVTHGSVTQKLQ